MRQGMLLLFVLACADFAQAQSLEQMIQGALTNNRDLQALRQRLPEAQGAKMQAGLRPNPTLDVTVGNGAVVRNSGYWDGGVGVSQVFELGGKRSRRLEAAQADISVIGWEIRDRERILRSSVATAYAEALAAERNLANGRQALELLSQAETVVAARIAQGEAPSLDRSLLAVELGRLRADIVLFGNQRSRSLSELRRLTGVPPNESLTLSTDLEAKPDSVTDQKDALQAAFGQRPDLRALEQMEKSAEASIRLEKALAIPNLTASTRFAYTYDFIQRVSLSPGRSVPITDQCPVLTVGISIELPWKNRNQGNIQAAMARKENVRLRREHQQAVISEEVNVALQRHQAAREATSIFQTQVLEGGRNNLRILRGVYEQGEARLLDVINEQRKLNDSQRSYTDLLKEQFLALVDVERATATEVWKESQR